MFKTYGTDYYEALSFFLILYNSVKVKLYILDLVRFYLLKILLF